jgi:hypothetical protein
MLKGSCSGFSWRAPGSGGGGIGFDMFMKGIVGGVEAYPVGRSDTGAINGPLKGFDGWGIGSGG